MYSGSKAIQDFKVWTKQLLWDLQQGLSEWLCVCAMSVSEITMSVFYNADSYQYKKLISTGDSCIALCKRFEKACEML